MPTSSSAPSSLKQILSDHFTVTTLHSPLTIKQFCEKNGMHISDRKSVHIFVELDRFKRSNLIDMILQDKVSPILVHTVYLYMCIQVIYINFITAENRITLHWLYCTKLGERLLPAS